MEASSSEEDENTEEIHSLLDKPTQQPTESTESIQQPIQQTEAITFNSLSEYIFLSFFKQ